MESTEGRIVVMPPGALAAATMVQDTHPARPHKGGADLRVGHDLFLFVARGEGAYRINGRTGRLRPNTLIAAPAGAFACVLSDVREMIVVSVRHPAGVPDDPRTFTPFLERQLSDADGRRWYERMTEYAARAGAGRFDAADVLEMKSAFLPYVWRREPHAAQALLHELFSAVWEQPAEPWTLERLAGDSGYTPNYLNDLSRAHTGRALGHWITDIRLARARAALERTDLPVADVGAACGYDDPAYFARAFRRAHGVPPATWRIAARPIDSRYSSVTISIDELHAAEVRRALPPPVFSFAT
jgi:AraC-like DNA-binding protein